MYFVALNLKTWLRACPCGQPASNLALLQRISLYRSRHAQLQPQSRNTVAAQLVYTWITNL